MKSKNSINNRKLSRLRHKVNHVSHGVNSLYFLNDIYDHMVDVRVHRINPDRPRKAYEEYLKKLESFLDTTGKTIVIPE